MEKRIDNDSIDVLKTQINSDVDVIETHNNSGWIWNLIMFLMGLSCLLVIGVLVLWQVGGAKNLINVLKFGAENDKSALVDNMPKLEYHIPNLNIGFEYPTSYFFDEISPTEIKVSLNLDSQRQISVVMTGVEVSSASGRIAFDCSRFTTDCTFASESQIEYINEFGMNGRQLETTINNASGSAKIIGYVFDIDNFKYSKFVIWPTDQEANELARAISQKVFLIEKNRAISK